MSVDQLGDWTVAHDFGFTVGGAERVTAALASEVVRSRRVVQIAGPSSTLASVGVEDVESIFPRIASERRFRALAPIYPVALPLRPSIPGNLLVSSYAFSHHIRCTGTKVVYCHSPLRQIWSGRDMYGKSYRGIGKIGFTALGPGFRKLDRAAARSADAYIATNKIVASRIEEYYGFSPVAIAAPPVDHSVFNYEENVERGGHLLWVGRIIEPYKRLSLALEAVRGTSHQLRVVGDGPDRARLEADVGSNVQFIGALNSRQLAVEYRTAAAVLFTSNDDFGLVPVEAMSCGAPTLAYRAGGAAETIADGETGLFFDEQNSRDLKAGIEQILVTSWDHSAISKYSAKYSLAEFALKVRGVLENTLALTKRR